MQDMVEMFKDESIMGSSIQIVMVNAFEKEEAGVDNRGIFRDALSAFWSAFYDSCTIGEQERVPVVRHDFQVAEWKAIARILVKGYKEVKFFPIKLNRVFMFAVLFNESQLNDELLIESFLSYISKDERDLINVVLKIDELSEEQQEEWIDFLDRFGCRRIPKDDERVTVILELAHKEMIQVAKYIICSWKEPCKELVSCAGFTSGLELMEFYSNKKPTVKKVLGLIEAAPSTNPERDVLSYLKRYVRGLDDGKLVKFLRFCTGATMICVNRIEVTFTNLDGIARRPVAHTCGAVLELPTTYQSFPQFREELNNIFTGEYWDIDIC